MIEQTNEIVRRVNRLGSAAVLPECRALLLDTGRLPGVDGRRRRASRSATRSARRDDRRGRRWCGQCTPIPVTSVSDPGHVEGNVVFAYLDAFDPDTAAVDDLKERYRRGGLGDVAIKRRLTDILEALIAPIRARRAEMAGDAARVEEILARGTARARIVAAGTLADVRAAMGLGVYAPRE